MCVFLCDALRHSSGGGSGSGGGTGSGGGGGSGAALRRHEYHIKTFNVSLLILDSSRICDASSKTIWEPNEIQSNTTNFGLDLRLYMQYMDYRLYM